MKAPCNRRKATDRHDVGCLSFFKGKTGWLTVAVNETRQMLNGNFKGDALVSFPRLSHER